MADRIDPDAPHTVPVKFRARINAAAARLAGTIEGDDAGDGVRQMLCDLLALAVNDGCVAAGWAFEVIAGKANSTGDISESQSRE